MTQTTDRPGATGPAGAGENEGGFTHRQIMTILAGLLLGMFLAALDQTVVSTAIRTIADDLQGYDLQAWATTAFLITSTITTPLYGKLSDMYGRRPFFMFAISVFVLGSLLCGISTSMYELAGWRALQGVGAGGLMSLALAIIADIVPPRQRARYQGWFMAVFGTSSVLGPVIGGFLAGQESILGLAGWRWIFWVNVPLGMVALAVVARNLHLPHRRSEHRIDWPGALGLVVFLVPLLVVAEQGRTWGWTDPRSLACYGIGVAGFVWFFLAERAYGDDALLPIRLFRNRTFAVGGLSSIVLGMGMFGGILLLPQYLQIVAGSSPTVAGLQMIPLVGGIMIGSVVAGQTISRTGTYRWFPLVGVVLIVAALGSLSQVVAEDTSVWLLVPFMVMLGLGLGFNFQPIILAVQNAVSPREIGVATSSVTFFRSLGGTLGAAASLAVLFGSLAGNITARAREAGLPQEVIDRFSSASALDDSTIIATLPDAVRQVVLQGFADSTSAVFLTVAFLLVPAFVLTLLVKEIPLRAQGGLAAAQADADTEERLAASRAETAVL